VGKYLLGRVLDLALKRAWRPIMSESEPRYLTMGEVAERLHCQAWRVARVFQRGLLPETPRVGRYRVVREDQVPEVKRALEKAGYLK
jgi:AraC-like DNA-binding protein